VIRLGRKIGLVSGKGGVGKSTIAANLAVALSRMGAKTIVVDADVEMATLHNYLGISPGKVSLKDVIEGKAYIEDALVEGPENVVVLPAKMSLYEISETKIPEIIKIIEPLADIADIMIIDGPAGLRQMPVAMMELCDDIVIVTGSDISAIQSGLKLRLVARAFNTNVLGIIVNRAPIDLGGAVIRKLEEVFEAPVLGIVPEDRSAKLGLKKIGPVVMTHPSSPFSDAINRIAMGITAPTTMPSGEERTMESFLEAYQRKYGRVDRRRSANFFTTLKSELSKQKGGYR